MSRRTFHELGFVMPGGWNDVSKLELRATSPSDGGFFRNLVVTREARLGRTPKQSFHAFQQRLVKARLPGLKMLEHRECVVAGRPAYDAELQHELELAEAPERLLLVRRQIYVESGDLLFSVSFADTPSGYATSRAELAAFLEDLTLAAEA